MVTYLKPEFDSRKSFYNKAIIKIENNKKHCIHTVQKFVP